MPDRIEHTPEDDTENGVLTHTESIDTSGLGIVAGATAQVSVELPGIADEEFIDDDVVDGEVPFASTDTYPEADEVDGEAVLEEPENSAETVTDHDDSDTVTGEIIHETVDVGSDEAIHEEIVVEVGEEDAMDADAADRAELALESDAETSERIEAFDALVRGGIAASDEAAAAAEAGAAAPAPAASAPAAPAVEAVAPAPQRATTPAPVAAMTAAATREHPNPTGSVPATRREAQHPEESARGERAQSVERIHPRSDVTLTSKRLGEFEADRETSDLLTPDRLLDPSQVVRPEPEGLWQHLLYSVSGHRINLGDGKRARSRKALDRRIAVPLAGGARFVPVLSRKGGVGKTTVTTLLGMALADARDDRIIAIDANPDRGTLAERITKGNGKTIRDLVRARADVTGYNDISSIVGRDDTRLDVLASDADPRVSEALNDRDYQDVASLAAHYYSIVLTDTGTGIVHSVMGATLEAADELVIVSGLSVDEARLASETLTWLETNGYSEQVRRAVVVLNNSRPGAPLVREDELEAHFRTRVRTVVRMPYDPLIAAGSAITFRDLQPATRLAARELAAAVVEGLRALAPAA